ncbi:hypothetical protein MYX64_01490 [Nitrospinae bacterium AH_259_B05_G02_I21]|nr:hypothetical protein [Nitrospinae bacterium AH_259_B05_G02_I21]MDA2932592.1 hypothetical protein [Nitrospinae bacterium AH-259-F20]
MEARIEKLENEMTLISEALEIMRKDSEKVVDSIAYIFYWFGNLLVSLQNKGVLDKSDLEAIRDIQKRIEQLRENALHDFLLQQIDEEGTPPQ